MNKTKEALKKVKKAEKEGYFIVSRKHRVASRIDREDWKEYMAAMTPSIQGFADKEKAELQAQINELREALEETKTFLDFNIELVQTDEFGNVEPANSYSKENKMKATEVKTHTDWLKYQHEQLERAAKREMELMEQIKKLLHIIVEQEKKLNETALERMAQNAKELGLDYCSHGSDSACKECYMEQTK